MDCRYFVDNKCTCTQIRGTRCAGEKCKYRKPMLVTKVEEPVTIMTAELVKEPVDEATVIVEDTIEEAEVVKESCDDCGDACDCKDDEVVGPDKPWGTA